ncbi:hypothetical protein Nos7524_3727 [Nostoc sp. PCC 7524]|nr:hypothetical protein Nos7524_3727 [Nostoc sp. PCC 7524]
MPFFGQCLDRIPYFVKNINNCKLIKNHQHTSKTVAPIPVNQAINYKDRLKHGMETKINSDLKKPVDCAEQVPLESNGQTRQF